MLFSSIAYPNELKKRKAQDVFPSPTFVEDTEVTVIRGGKVKIPLISKPLAEETKFYFRTQPTHGTLKNLVVTKSGAAFVEYYHNELEGSIDDEFYYAAQRPGCTVSSRARAVIRVRERPPKLEVISHLDFGDVPINSTQPKSLQIKNTGGVAYSSKLKLPSSTWESEQNGRQIEILPGKALFIPIAFKPEIPGKVKEIIKFEGEGGASVELIGCGYEVFRVSSHQIRLLPDFVISNKRQGVIRITNTYNTDIDVYFKMPDELEPIESIKLPILGSESIFINAKKDIKKGGKCELWIQSLGVNQKIDISIIPLPPHLLFDPDGLCDFGKISKNNTSERLIKITNTGGSVANLNVTIPEWIEPIPNKYSIQSGENLNLLLRSRFTKIKENDIIKFNYNGIEKSISTKIYYDEIYKFNSIYKNSKNDIDKFEPPAIDLEKIRSKSIQLMEASCQNGMVKIVWKDTCSSTEKYSIEKREITSLVAEIQKQILSLDTKSSFSNTENYMNEKAKLIQKRDAALYNNRVLEKWNPIVDSKFYVNNSTGDKIVTFAAPGNINSINIRLIPESNPLIVHSLHVPIHYEQKDLFAFKGIVIIILSILLSVGIFVFFRKYKIIFSNI